MPKIKLWLLCALLVPMVLVACGGDDDESDADPTATTSAAVATVTTEPEAEPTDESSTAGDAEATGEADITPTEEVEATATEEAEATPTEEAEATATEDSGAMAETPATGMTTPGADETPAEQVAADPEAEARLFEVILAEEDLPEGWTQTAVGPSNDVSSNLGFCNAEPFAGIEERLAGVEAEFEQSADLGPFLLQDLTAYPEELAIQAMDYTREITTNCTEWTDDEGLAYTLAPQDQYPTFGDDSFVIRITIEVPQFGPVASDFVFARVGGTLMLMGYVDAEEIDPAAVEEVVTLAIEKMQGAEV